MGECGLDYSEGFPSAELQLPWFEKQVELACKVSDDDDRHRKLGIFLGAKERDCLFLRSKQDVYV